MTMSRRRFATSSLAAATGAAALPTALTAQEASSAASSAAARDGILVPEHFVPTPTTISPQAQAFLNAKFPVGEGGGMPPRSDIAAWQAYRQQRDNALIAAMTPMAEKFPATVTTRDLPNCKIYEIVPENLAPEHEKRAIIYVHGGGFFMGGGQAAVLSARRLAGDIAMRVFSVDYRLVPDVAFPDPVLDVVDAYEFVLQRYDGDKIAFFGGSAGANLAPAAILKSTSIQWPLPAACVIHSAVSDMAGNGDTLYTNMTVDTVLRQRSPDMNANYANGHDLKDPLLSPVYGDYAAGFPPTLLTSGTRDMLLSDTVRLHRAMVNGGGDAHLHVWEAMPHAPFFGSPEEKEVTDLQKSFILEHMA